MRRALPLVLALASACGSDPEPADGGPPDGTAGTVDARGSDAAPGSNPLDGAGAATLVDGGYMFLEGPVWRAADGVLLFSDIPANTIFRLAPPSAIDTFRADSGNSNGLAEDTDGLLLAAEHGNRRVSRTEAGGAVVDVATMFQGMSLNSPNDIAVRSDGTIYFTDPPYGIDPGTQQELSFNGVFRVAPGGGLSAEWQGGLSTRPNGIALSPDESVLYVSDTTGPVRAYDVATDGTLSGERVFSSAVSGGDGVCMDVDGNLFVTASTGVMAFAPDGTLWGTITVAEQPANCTFGGADKKTLYITARTGLYAAAMVIPGR